MFIFWRLLLAHLVADFALQTNLVYRWRVSYQWGVILHSSIFAFFSIVSLTPYLSSYQTWLAILILWGTHTILDKLKINYMLSTGEDNLWWFLLDQGVHLVIIGGASLALEALEPIKLPEVYKIIYDNDLLIKYASGYVFTLFVPVALIYYVEKTWRGSSRTVIYPSPHNKYTGVFERLAVLSFLLAGDIYYYFVPLPLIFSWYLQSLEMETDTFRIPRLMLSLAVCLLTSRYLLSQLS